MNIITGLFTTENSRKYEVDKNDLETSIDSPLPMCIISNEMNVNHSIK
jgi:hypothetical protein